MKALRFSKSKLLWYLGALPLFYLCARARITPELPGFALSMFAALVYCRGNVLLLSPMYVAGCLLCDASLSGILYALVPAAVFIAAVFAHRKLARSMNLLTGNLYAFLSLLPAVLARIGTVSILKILLSVAVTQTVCCLCLTFCYALIVRGISHKFSPDEMLGGATVVAVAAMGLYSLNLFGYRPYDTALGFLLLYSVYALPSGAALALNVGFAAGSCLSQATLSPAGAVLTMFLIACVFRKTDKRLCAAAVLLADLLCGVYFRAFADFGYIHVAALAAGLLIFLLLPKKVCAKLCVFRPTDGSVGAKNMLNRTKKDLAQRVRMLGGIFYEMAGVYGNSVSALPAPQVAAAPLAREWMLATCADCPQRESCMKALGGGPARVLEGVMDSGLAAGKITLVDLPNFINARCVKIPALLADGNRLLDVYYNRLRTDDAYMENQRLLSTELAGIGSVLQCIADDVSAQVSLDADTEERIITELGYNNVVCTEANVYVNGGEKQVSVVVRKEDADKRALQSVLEQLLGFRLVAVDRRELIGEEKLDLSFAPAPKYDLAYFCCQSTKEGERASGDVITITRLRSNKILVGLCDGMGSGESAQSDSSGTLDMICNFYKAGFDNVRALALVNKLLAVTGKENFSALDMCVVHLESGCADFIKLGGVESYIRRSDGIEVVEAQALPIGIVEEARPEVRRVMLAVGDMAVLVSDGITDALTSEGIQFILDKIGSLNPEDVCNEIMGQAKRAGLGDDSSVIAFRLFANCGQ